ncbi:hypothetical protein [Nocardioides sp. NPDC047086]
MTETPRTPVFVNNRPQSSPQNLADVLERSIGGESQMVEGEKSRERR